MAPTPEEAAVYRAHMEAAWGRYIVAIYHEQNTRSLPPGDTCRDMAVREWRWAEAVAEEWGLI